MEDWYKITLYRLIEVCKRTASKYTRSKVRKALPPDFAYVIEELITEKSEITDKESYYNSIVNTIIRIGRAEKFIVALSELIQRLTVDHLHIVGDIYDRGPGPHIIMDQLIQYHSVDIQWGNHDVLWMGAAAGQRGCIANVIRICARYGNLDILEDGYGINLLPLANFAMNTYGDDPCTCFKLRGEPDYSPDEMKLDVKMHKAISVIQFKVEGQIIKKNPGFKMNDRNLLHKINFETGMVEIDGKEYPMLDRNFPTVDPRKPYALSAEEEDIMERLEKAFLHCERLQRHMRFLLNKGGLYKVYNNNLLYHGCVPLTAEGELMPVRIYGRSYKGRGLYEELESYVRKGFYALDEKEKERGRDMMWYIWLGEGSPLFGKDKMATFERYFLEDKETHKEKKNPYYSMLTYHMIAAAQARGYQVLTCATGWNPQKEVELLRMLYDRNVDGIFYVPDSLKRDPVLYETLCSQHFPLINYCSDESDFATVAIDYSEGFRLAVADLARRHRRIGYITSVSTRYRSLQESAKTACRLAGVELFERRFEGIGLPECVEVIADYVRTSDIFAFIVNGSVTAVRLINQLEQFGIRVPQDIEIVGIGDLEVLSLFRPALSCINYDTAAMMEQAVELLIRYRESGPGQVALVPSGYIARNSTLST